MPGNETAGTLNGRDTGIIVLGHGSRAPDAGRLLGWLRERLEQRLDCRVLAAALQFNRPTLEDCCRELAAQGVRRILVAPYFLYEGNHFRQDIPEGLEALRESFPGVEFILTGTLGTDERLVEVLEERIETHRVHEGPTRSEEAGRPHEDAIPRNGIEVQSFDIIDGLLQPDDPQDPEYQITRRVVHATGDPGIAGHLLLSDGAVDAALSAFAKRSPIICDVNMAASGIEPTARRRGLEVRCGVAAGETAELARREGITRGAAGMRLAASGGLLDGSVAVVGNAPTALWEVIRLADERQIRPAVVIGVPVGFVGAAESKQALAASDIPFITLPGNRGGSSVAVAVVNALLRMENTGKR